MSTGRNCCGLPGAAASRACRAGPLIGILVAAATGCLAGVTGILVTAGTGVLAGVTATGAIDGLNSCALIYF